MNTNLQKTQWFFDDSGYYSYVLLDGSENEFAEIQNSLQRAGIRVLLAGPSHRPARNNRQYKWYVRVSRSDRPGIAKPSLEQITEVLSPVLVTHARPDRPDMIHELQTGESDDQLRESEAKTQHLENLLALARAQLRQLSSELEHMQAVQERYKRLSVEWSSQIGELQAYRRENSELRTRLVHVSNRFQTSDEIVAVQSEYEIIVQQVQEKLDRKEAEFVEWLALVDQEIDAKNARIIDQENQLAEVRFEKEQLIESAQHFQIIDTTSQAAQGTYDLFRETVQILMPEVELIGGSYEYLWQGTSRPQRLLSEVRGLDYAKGTRVRGAPHWLERRPDRVSRIYYRRSAASGRRYVLISHKKSQLSDIEWLKLQPVD